MSEAVVKHPNTVKLSYRPPYNVPWMLAFFKKRQLDTTENITTEFIAA
jgi:AlkA N-terminal domain